MITAIECRETEYKDEKGNAVIEYKCLECGNWEYEVAPDGQCYVCFMIERGILQLPPQNTQHA